MTCSSEPIDDDLLYGNDGQTTRAAAGARRQTVVPRQLQLNVCNNALLMKRWLAIGR